MMMLWVGHDSRTQKLQMPIVTLTFDLATWFLHATLCLVMIICAKYCSNPTMHDEVMGRTRFKDPKTLSADCDLDI